MKWIKERDELIAQTMAFVQSVTGRKDFRLPEAAAAPPAVAIEVATVVAPVQAADVVEPAQPLPAPQAAVLSPPRMAGEFRSEIQARVANFRKYQERFEREREEYCATTLAKLRAAIRDGAAGPTAGT